MNRNVLWIAAAVTGLGLIGCGSSHHNTPAASTPPVNSAPTDFANFVNQQLQLQPQPGINVAPAVTTSLTTDLALGEATEFSGVTFGKGDSLPTGTNQAVVACTQAGQAACNPGVSNDLNSNLN
ncbi:MAG TPA: hypothetical protein VHY19_08125 [Steroidobacteraceae bacterium]|jgi:hypothetical protein|nr:hypothetical protein [Steroidobacteraceae bacterium]